MFNNDIDSHYIDHTDYKWDSYFSGYDAIRKKSVFGFNLTNH